MAGRCGLDAGDNETAATHWNLYIRRFKGREHMDQALLGLAHAGQGSGSLKVLLDNNANSPLAHSALFEWARILEAQEDHAGAANRYQRLLENFPLSEHAATAHYGLAWCLNSTGDFEQATSVLHKLLMKDVDTSMQIAARELLSWTAVEAGDLRSALANYSELQRSGLDRTRLFTAAKKLALALKAKGDNERALQLLRPFTTEGSTPVLAIPALVESTWIALDSGATDDAENYVRAAAKLTNSDTTVSEAAFFVGEARFIAQDFQRAAALYEFAAGTQGSTVAAQALYKLGFARLSYSDAKGAAKAFAQLTRDHRDSALWGESLYLQGESLIRSGDLQAAIAPLQELRRSRPKHAVMPKALFRLGLALQQTGQAKEGLNVLSQLVGKFSEFEAWVEAELHRGLCLVALNRPREARSAFDRVLAKDKGILSARARIQIGRLHLTQEDDEAALAEFLKVALLYAHDEEVAEALFLTGHCLERQGNQTAAIGQYNKAVKDHARTAYAKQCTDRLHALGQ
ncbi:MAG: tetratricopeptide repeat protein [Planctomycetes bacterium]|nr:tetratricopeptide repeat protein [Planctomycetota bacterium]